MINTKRTRTSSKIVCNEKEAPWMQIAFHYKARFGIVFSSGLEIDESDRCKL
jgi:hypothetical protein